MTTYTNKSNAVRAAKREFGEGNFEVKATGDGLWAYIRSGALDAATTAPALTDEEKAIVDNSAVVSVADDGALVGEGDDGTETVIAPATRELLKTTDLGNGWFANAWSDATMTIRNPDAGQRIDLGADSVQLLRDILKGAKGFKAPKGPRKARDGGPTLREQAAALLTQKDGTTSKDILALTKWPSVSVPALAAASKLTLEKKKVDGVTRYYGTPMAA